MSLVKLSYSEYEGLPRYWEINDFTFSKINLIVGKNASGKSRLMSVINSFSKLLTGSIAVPFEDCKFSATLILNGNEFCYEIEFKNRAVFNEKLLVNGANKLSRGKDGAGEIRYEQENKSIPFKLPPDAVAAVNRRDEIQHPFLIELHEWANSVILFLFGKDFGQSRVLGINDAITFINNPNPTLFDDPNDLVRVYSSAFTLFKEDFDKAVIKDMNTLGYSLKDVGSDNLQAIMQFPTAALAMFTVESDLDFKNPQMHISQGMYRALAIVINLNASAFSKNKQLILIDDIGEGLDYERSVSIINLIIDKAKSNDMQVLMTSNDRFVMNEVPLEYWSIIKRKAGVVKMFNHQNSQKEFDKFKYIGLSNFDFFASNLFDSEVVND